MGAALWLSYRQLADKDEADEWIRSVERSPVQPGRPACGGLIVDLREGVCAPAINATLSSVWHWLRRKGVSRCAVVCDTDSCIAFAAVFSPLDLEMLILDTRIAPDWRARAEEWTVAPYRE